MDLPIAPRGAMLISVASIISFLVVVAVTLRMIRNVKFKKFSWDEPLIVIAMLAQLATAGLGIGSVMYGNGRHIYDFPNHNIPFMTIELPWVSQPCAAVALLMAKASLSVTLLQLGLGRSFNVIVLCAFSLVAIADIWSIVQIVAGCSPSSAPRNGAVCSATSLSVGVAFFLCAANGLADIVFFAAPEFFLRKTQLHPRDRVVIRVLLAFIFAATIMSIVKIVYLKTLLSQGDVSFNSPPVTATSIAESGFSIIAACLPAIRQLAGKHFPKHWMVWKTMASNSTVTADRMHPQTKTGASRDIERGFSRASYAPTYSTRDIKIMNDVDFCEEDEDGVKLIPYVSRSGRVTPATIDRATSPSIAPKSPSITISTSIVEESPPQVPAAAKQRNYAESLQGRLSSRFRALDPQDRAILAEEAGPPTRYQPHTRVTEMRSETPVKTISRSLSRSSARSGDRLSGTYSTASRRSAHLAEPSTTNGSNVILQQVQLPSSSRFNNVTGPYRHQGSDSIYTTTTTSTSQSDNAFPNAPFYYENNKIRESARTSLDQQQDELTQQQQQQRQQYTPRQGSPFARDFAPKHSGTGSQSWL